jgi:farnesyl diphosphate synthase
MSAAKFSEQLAQWQARAEIELARRLPPESQLPERLHAAMRYAVLGGGKRVRPVLTYATGLALALDPAALDDAACAIEFIHAYSLIHDDLPAMDDDDLRRGKPSCHKAFDEATAILAGDALQVLAFEIIARDGLPTSDPSTRLQLIRILSAASGTQGMAGGQALDLAAAGRTLTLEEVVQMHAWKTGALIRASVMMAAACAKPAAAELDALSQFADAIGLAFQIQDDLLDIEGDPLIIGKAVGADQARAKPTYPAVSGIDAARRRVQELHGQAVSHLQLLGEAAQPLREVSEWLVFRRQ